MGLRLAACCALVAAGWFRHCEGEGSAPVRARVCDRDGSRLSRAGDDGVAGGSWHGSPITSVESLGVGRHGLTAIAV